MSSKRAKRHQLIVRASNGNRAQNKRAGLKVHDVMLMPFRTTPKPRFRNLQSELFRVWRRITMLTALLYYMWEVYHE